MTDQRELFGAADVVPGSDRADYEGAVLVLNPEVLKPQYRTAANQLWRAFGGFGCDPDNIGTKVFARCLSDGEETSWRRWDFLGIIRPELLPSSTEEVSR
jgi:hypothetical protein